MTGDDRERAEFFEALRRSSAKLLKLDPDHLSASQSVRVDRCAALRMLLDRFQSQQLSGGEIDAKAFIAASAELERLLGGEPDKPTSVLASSEGRAKLRALIERTLMAGEVDDEAERLRVRDREEAIAVQAALPVEAAKPAPPSPAAEQTSQPSNVSYLPSRTADGRPPPHYLADYQRQHEPWRGAAEFTVPSWPLPR
jgi:hypothetical protein